MEQGIPTARRRRRHPALVLVGAAIAFGSIGGPAAADVCVATDFGMTCAGPGGGTTKITIVAGCCVFIESDGPIVIGRTGLTGTGVQGQRATVHLVVGGFETAHVDVQPDKASVFLRMGDQRLRVLVHVGCCVEVTASGPMALGGTGVYGNEDHYSVMLDGERRVVCSHTNARPTRCREEGISLLDTIRH